MPDPKRLTDPKARETARRIRDSHWALMERMRDRTIWVCPWNKYRMEGGPGEVRFDLISGCEWFDWVGRHQDWFQVGEWSEERCARAMTLTDAGRAALADREPYDMEDFHGGLVEPGYVVTPSPPAAPGE